MTTTALRMIESKEAAISLLPKGPEGKKILAKLTTVLVNSLGIGKKIKKGKKVKTTLLFATMELILAHAMKTFPKVAIANMSLETARAAIDQASPKQAAEYSEVGIRVLGKKGWSSHYLVCYELHCMAATSRLRVREYDTSLSLGQDIIDHAVVEEHKWKAHLHLIEVYEQKKDYRKCAVACNEALRALGVDTVVYPGIFHLWSRYRKLKRILGGRQPKDLESHPWTEEQRVKDMTRVMDYRCTSFFCLGKDVSFLHEALLMLNMLLANGMTDRGITAFIAYGILLSEFGSSKEAFAYFELAYNSVMRGKGKDFVMACNITHIHTFGHVRPMAEAPKDILLAFKEADKMGDLYLQVLNLRFYVMTSFYVSRLTEFDQVRSFALDYYNDTEENVRTEMTAPFFQLAENLSGRNADPLVLTGTFMNFDEVMGMNAKKDADLRLTQMFGWSSLTLFNVIMGRDEVALQADKEYRTYKEDVGAFFLKIMHNFHAALACFSIWARLTRNKQTSASRLSRPTYAVNDIPMIKTMLLTIEAEKKKLSGDHEEALQMYLEASREFGDHSFHVYKAIALERVGSIDRLYLFDACEAYKDYGALLKVGALLKQNPCLGKERLKEQPLVEV